MKWRYDTGGSGRGTGDVKPGCIQPFGMLVAILALLLAAVGGRRGPA